MGKNNPFAALLALIALSVLVIVLFPGLLVVIAIAAAYMWFRFRRVKKQMEQELNERPQPTWQDDLFQEQASRLKRTEDAEVIDVEFTRKDENEEKRQSI